MHLDGWTLALQALNFLVLLFLLHRFLWKPVTAMIARRRKELEDAAAEVKAKEAAADESRRAFEAKSEVAERERAGALAEAAAQIAAQREEAVGKARLEAEAELAAAREKLGEERRVAAGELTGDAVDLGVAIARKLLGSVRSPAVAAAFVDRICEHLDGLPAEELASLVGELAASPTVRVAAAPALDPAAQALLSEKLASRLGTPVRLELVTDDALIAGAELRFAHARIGDSFQHGLTAAREELVAAGAGATAAPLGAAEPREVGAAA